MTFAGSFVMMAPCSWILPSVLALTPLRCWRKLSSTSRAGSQKYNKTLDRTGNRLAGAQQGI
jgi:hypothetical protein